MPVASVGLQIGLCDNPYLFTRPDRRGRPLILFGFMGWVFGPLFTQGGNLHWINLLCVNRMVSCRGTARESGHLTVSGSDHFSSLGHGGAQRLKAFDEVLLDRGEFRHSVKIPRFFRIVLKVIELEFLRF